MGHFARYTAYLSLGAEVAGAIGAAAVAGYYLDEWLDTSPLFVLILVIVSTVAVFVRIIRILSLLEKNDRE